MFRVREMVGLRTVGWKYGQRAVVATVRMEALSSLHHTAWQRFLPTGPLALLPMRDGYSNIVWSTTAAEAQRLEALDGRDFAAEVNRALLVAYADPPPSPAASFLKPSPKAEFQPPPIVSAPLPGSCSCACPTQAGSQP